MLLEWIFALQIMTKTAGTLITLDNGSCYCDMIEIYQMPTSLINWEHELITNVKNLIQQLNNFILKYR